MKLCVVSFKECWQNEAGDWFSTGGFPLQIAAIASLFDETILCIVKGNPNEGGMPLPKDARVVPLRSPSGVDLRRKLSAFINLPYYWREIVRHARKADAVHVPLPGDLSFWGMLVALLLRKRLIARYGGSWGTTSQTTMMNRVTKACMRWFAGGRNVMLATGLGIHPPARNMHWLYVTTISDKEVDCVSPNLERAAQNPLQIAYVGRLSEEKGIKCLISALGALNQDPELASLLPFLTLIGDGPQREELIAMVDEQGLSGQVEFAGQLNRMNLVRRLLTMDVCILPSLTESLCKARLDAMLCGVPVITTEVGFGREIIGQEGERGWLMPPSNASALAAILKCILTEPQEWVSLRKRCREYAEKFTLDAWTKTVGEICARQWNMFLVGGKLRE